MCSNSLVQQKTYIVHCKTAEKCTAYTVCLVSPVFLKSTQAFCSGAGVFFLT